MPIVLAGARITAEQLLDDHAMTVPWTDNGNGGGSVRTGAGARTELDRIRRPLWVKDTNLMLAGLVAILVLLVLHYAGASSHALFVGDW